MSQFGIKVRSELAGKTCKWFYHQGLCLDFVLLRKSMLSTPFSYRMCQGHVNNNQGVAMTYKAIEIDRKNLTIMGVRFPDLETLDSTAGAIGSNMFEGFEPTKKASK